MSNSTTADGIPASAGFSMESREDVLSASATLTDHIGGFFCGKFFQLEPPPLSEPLEKALNALERLALRDGELLAHAIGDLGMLLASESAGEPSPSPEDADEDFEPVRREDALRQMLSVIESSTQLTGDLEGTLDVSAVIRAVYALKQTLTEDSSEPETDYQFLVSDFANTLIQYLDSVSAERRIRHLKALVEAIREDKMETIQEKGSQYIVAAVKSAELKRLANALRMVAQPTSIPALTVPDSPQ